MCGGRLQAQGALGKVGGGGGFLVKRDEASPKVAVATARQRATGTAYGGGVQTSFNGGDAILRGNPRPSHSNTGRGRRDRTCIRLHSRLNRSWIVTHDGATPSGHSCCITWIKSSSSSLAHLRTTRRERERTECEKVGWGNRE